MSPCPSDEAIALFLQGKLGQKPANDLRHHLDECTDCRALIADAARAHTGSVPIAAVQVGDILGKKYLVEELLGTGGMGAVFRGRHIELSRPVAIKVMHPSLADDPTAVRRVSREARATAALTSPHTVRILDTDRGPNGAPYIVMELLDGQDLGTVLAREGPLPVAQVLDFGLQACAALIEAHAAGIVHRDLKPTNLLLTRDGTLKVVDFGLAKRLPFGNESMAGDTRTKTLVGSPQYMAPEQIQTPKSVDERIDIWSLGATLYTLLTATPPFNGPNLHVVCMRILREEPPSLPAQRPDVPEVLVAAILRCLEKDRDRRFWSIADLAVELRAADDTLGSTGTPSEGDAAPTTITVAAHVSNAPRTRRTDSLPPTQDHPPVEAAPGEPTLKDDATTPRIEGSKPRHESFVVAMRRDDPRHPPVQHLLRGAVSITVGRGDKDQLLTRNDGVLELKLEDPHLSTRHFSLERAAGGSGFRLLDLGSTNGTLLNGVPHREGLLVDRDVIEAGRTLFVLRSFDGPPALEPVLTLPGAEHLASMAPATQAILRALPQVATTRLPLVLEGEAGTGKEQLARAVHRLSNRSGAFVRIHGEAFSTEVTRAEIEQLAQAHAGTLFLDGIAGMPLTAQERLVRAVQEREIRSLASGSGSIPFDVRFIIGTEVPLRTLAGAGAIREELATRNAGSTIKLQPLRERIEDVGLIVRALLLREPSRASVSLSSAAARALLAYRWPGNVRELERLLDSVASLAGAPIRAEDLPEALQATVAKPPESLDNSEVVRTPRLPS